VPTLAELSAGIAGTDEPLKNGWYRWSRMEGAMDNAQIIFDAPAKVRKWPSLGNVRRSDRVPYSVHESTLEECLQFVLAKPQSSRQLYDIHTAPQPPLIPEVLSGEHLLELARLREFL
jgi:hypothetical protein